MDHNIFGDYQKPEETSVVKQEFSFDQVVEYYIHDHDKFPVRYVSDYLRKKNLIVRFVGSVLRGNKEYSDIDFGINGTHHDIANAVTGLLGSNVRGEPFNFNPTGYDFRVHSPLLSPSSNTSNVRPLSYRLKMECYHELYVTKMDLCFDPILVKDNNAEKEVESVIDWWANENMKKVKHISNDYDSRAIMGGYP